MSVVDVDRISQSIKEGDLNEIDHVSTGANQD